MTKISPSNKKRYADDVFRAAIKRRNDARKRIEELKFKKEIENERRDTSEN